MLVLNPVDDGCGHHIAVVTPVHGASTDGVRLCSSRDKVFVLLGYIGSGFSVDGAPAVLGGALLGNDGSAASADEGSRPLRSTS